MFGLYLALCEHIAGAGRMETPRPGEQALDI